MNEESKEYSNATLTVVWKSHLCKHAAECVRNSPKVFHPKERPWITLDAASSDEIRATVGKCPSGALSVLDV